MTRLGGRSIDMSAYPPIVNATNRHIRLALDAQSTNGSATVSVQLQDVTDNATITGATFTTSNVAATYFTTSDLTVGSSAGNIRNDKIAQYELQGSIMGGGPSDQAIVVNARLVIFYA
jgi:hypothetical protein